MALIVKVYPDLVTLNQAAAELFSRYARQAASDRGQFFICLSGGSTPMQLYSLLSQPPYQSSLPWQITQVFWGDERMVPADHPESNYAQASSAWLGKVPVQAQNIHRMRGELSPEQAAADYRIQLKQQAAPGLEWPRFDLTLLGIGADGHIASIFPGMEPNRSSDAAVLPTRMKYAGRPVNRLTLTPAVFNSARQILFLAAGSAKAAAVAAALNPLSQLKDWPARQIHPLQGDVTWLLDEQAVADCPPGLRSNP